MLLLLPGVVLGQTSSTSSPATAPTEMRVSIITIGPGDAVWEKFGHNMLRIQIPSKNIDVSFNWGLFEFDDHFIAKFLQGKLIYSMGPFYTDKAFKEYTDADREMWEQELNLSLSQKQNLWDFCVWNSQPENAEYRYDYYRDNCSTRVRDAVDLSVGGQLKAQASTQPSNVTYRTETNRLMAGDLLTYTGLYFILGHPVEQPISAWEEMFIPMRMRVRLNEMTIRDESGKLAPLVKSQVQLHKSSRIPPPDEPPNYLWIFLLLGVLIGGAEAGLAGARKRIGRWSFAIVAMFWSLLAGFGGWFMLYAFTTDHLAVRYNENILQLSPLLLPLVFVIPLALSRRPRAGQIAWVLSAIALAASLLGLVLKVLPMMYQTNANIIALAIPANAGLAYAAWRLRKLPPRGAESKFDHSDLPRKGLVT
jgi:hypothetical protein